MRVGLINLEPKIVNTALMQIAAYYGNTEWAEPLMYHVYDRLYASSLFGFTDKSQLPDNTIIGGTGFDLTTSLPSEIEECDYDYSIYPQCDYSILWFSRGCIRKCPFCVVWKKEGGIKSVCPKPLNPKGTYIKIQDNNFFANPEWHEACRFLKSTGQRVEFSSGIDIRIMNDRQGRALSKLKIQGQIHTAWDNPKEDVLPHFDILLRHVKPYRVMCYVLIGYWSTPEEDLYRVEKLREIKIDPYVMPYDKTDPYQRRFARWVNHKAIFKKVKWEDYGRRKQYEKDKLAIFAEAE